MQRIDHRVTKAQGIERTRKCPHAATVETDAAAVNVKPTQDLRRRVIDPQDDLSGERAPILVLDVNGEERAVDAALFPESVPPAPPVSFTFSRPKQLCTDRPRQLRRVVRGVGPAGVDEDIDITAAKEAIGHGAGLQCAEGCTARNEPAAERGATCRHAALGDRIVEVLDEAWVGLVEATAERLQGCRDERLPTRRGTQRGLRFSRR